MFPFSVSRCGLRAAAFVISFLALFSSTVAQTADPVAIYNFSRVNDNYFRGSQPTAATMKELAAAGIKTVIDLRKDKIAAEEGWAAALGMKYVNIPMRASRPATEEQAEYFLTLVNDPANWPVYVHCKGGRHRTGALTAIYRITNDGWTAEQAWQEMKDHDFNKGFFGGPGAQKRYVFSFYDEHQRSVAAPATD